jgi:hypothetical protein
VDFAIQFCSARPAGCSEQQLDGRRGSQDLDDGVEGLLWDTLEEDNPDDGAGRDGRQALVPTKANLGSRMASR